MSTGDTAPPPVAATLLHHSAVSDSTMSSPLSEVKDADPDDMDVDHIDHLPASRHDASDSTSNLSDIHSDPPESEAETDRLFDSPEKPAHHKDVFVDHNNDAKVFERSPSKLQQELVLEDAPSKGACPLPSSPIRGKGTRSPSRRSGRSPNATLPTDAKHSPNPQAESRPTEKPTVAPEPDTRKRKRSVAPDDSDSDAPLRKRTGSVQAPEKDATSAKSPRRRKSSESPHRKGGDHSGEEDTTVATLGKKKTDPPKPTPVDNGAHSTPDTPRSRKRNKRPGARKRKSPAETDNTDIDQSHDTHDDEAGTGADDEATHGAEDHHDGDGDHGVDTAHKNEEELEKKRLAYDQLACIEKHFAAFRDRLYEERLEQLNQEEAMLRGDSPTHPEYLAMKQCLDSRLQDQLRYAESHLKHDLDSLNTWAVARRGQIMAQYHQGVRASRERALSELGKQWFEIQYERRRRADNTPDFGIRFPTHKQQQIRHAVAYNKEVSILSGVAKYQGFPAAPELSGAVQSEVDDDLDAITRARQPLPSVVQQFPEYGVSNRYLGPAGEQFLEQTPWANPNHPSHQVPRHQHGPAESSPVPRRQLSQQNPFAIQGSIQGLSNGQSIHKSNSRAHHHSSELPGSTRPATHGKGQGSKGVAPDMAVKHEALPPTAMV